MQQRVLIIGPKFYGYCDSVQKAFSKLGFHTSLLTFSDNEVENITEKIGYHLSKDKKHFFDKKREAFGKMYKKKYDSYQPNIMFIIKGSCFFPESIQYAKNSINILWMMDSIYRNDYSFALRNKVDFLFSFENTDVERLKNEENIKAYFLPPAVDESVYFPVQNKKEIDLLFVGALYKNRIALLRKLADLFPQKKIKVYGHLFSPIKHPFRYFFRKDKEVFTNKNVDPVGLNQLYSKTRICLNIHHEQSVTGVNPRFFEILGTRSLELVDKKAYIEEQFNREEVLWYENEADMVAKIDEALKNYDQLEYIKENGYRKVSSMHTYTKRIEFVLKTIQYKGLSF